MREYRRIPQTAYQVATYQLPHRPFLPRDGAWVRDDEYPSQSQQLTSVLQYTRQIVEAVQNSPKYNRYEGLQMH